MISHYHFHTVNTFRFVWFSYFILQVFISMCQWIEYVSTVTSLFTYFHTYLHIFILYLHIFIFIIYDPSDPSYLTWHRGFFYTSRLGVHGVVDWINLYPNNVYTNQFYSISLNHTWDLGHWQEFLSFFRCVSVHPFCRYTGVSVSSLVTSTVLSLRFLRTGGGLRPLSVPSWEGISEVVSLVLGRVWS